MFNRQPRPLFLVRVATGLFFGLVAVGAALAQAPVVSVNLSPPRAVVAVGQNLTLNVTHQSDTSGTFTDDDGSSSYTYQWLKSGLPIVGATSSSFALTGAKTTDAGWYQVVVTNGSGSTTSPVVFVNVDVTPALVSVFGYNADGETTVPAGLTDVISVAGGANSLAALKGDGTVVAWGAGTTNTGVSPNFGQSIVPGGLSNVVAIAAGDFHVLALKADGTVVGWGRNEVGETTIPTLVNPVAIAAKANSSYALQADGTVVAWGAGVTPPGGLSNVVAITAGSIFAVALKSDGTVVAWGTDFFGTTEVPSGLSNVVAIASGNLFTVALKSDGTVVAWGDNTYGETNVPAGLSNVIAVSASGGFALAFKSDGTVVAWGNNPDGEYTGLSALTKVVGASAGPRFSVILQNTPLSITTQPTLTAVTALNTANFSVVAAGDPSLTYQWQKDGVNLTDGTLASGAVVSGSNTATLQISNAQAADSGSKFGVVVSSATDSILSLPATLTVNRIATTFGLNSTSFTYNNSAQGPTINPTPSGATFTSGGTLSATNVGSYTATATATGNYTGTNNALAWSIAKASQSAPVISSGSTVTYGSTYTATANTGFGAVTWALGSGSTAPGASIDSGGVVSFTGTGTVVIKAQFAGDANHNASAFTSDFPVTVGPEPVTFSLDNNSFTYSGSAQGPNVVASVPGATFTTGGTLSATPVGDYTATASATGNYSGSNSSLNWSIAKATATVTLGSLTATYDGNPHAATATTPPSGLTVDLTYNGSSTAPTAAGTYTVVGTVNDSNYTGSASGTLTISALQYHSADTNQDYKISLSELLRVITLYNYSSSGSRTGEYHSQNGTVDGFAPGPGSLTSYHTADTNHDGKISLSELLRVITLYNYSSSGSRTGQYHVQSGTVDGFAPGP